MTVLFFTSDYKPRPGGIAEHTHQFATYFDERGEEVIVVAPRTDGAAAFDRRQWFQVVRTPGSGLVGTAALCLWFAVVVVRRDVDWVYCPMWFPTGVVGVALGSLLGIRTVVAVHAREVVYTDGSLRKRVKSSLRPVQARVFESATFVLAVSSYTRQRVLDLGVTPDQVHVVNNGVDPERFDDTGERELDAVLDGVRTLDGTPVEDRDGPVLLTVARLDPRKGHDVVLRALPSIRDQFGDVTYLIAGSGDDERERELQDLARELGVADAVAFMSYVPEADLPALYDACDVFVMPNRREGDSVEGFGIVFLEANAAGRPVVAGDHGGATDAVDDGETGLLVDPNDPAAVSEAVCELLSDDERREQLGENGRQRVESEFTWADAGDRLTAIMESADSNDRRGEVR